MKRVFSFSCTTMLSAAASLAVALVITAKADAAPIRFDNPVGPGHFQWAGAVGEFRWLDITHAANDQLNVDMPSALRHVVNADGSGDVASSGGPMDADLHVDTTFQIFAEGLSEGTGIPAGFPWTDGAATVIPGFGEGFAENQQVYLGVRFNLGLGTQYGWIGVTRTGPALDAFAWGYETEPGVPIAAGVPEPGTLSLLVLSSTALLSRRRQRLGK